jgi:hypothetical protein
MYDFKTQLNLYDFIFCSEHNLAKSAERASSPDFRNLFFICQQSLSRVGRSALYLWTLRIAAAPLLVLSHAQKT